MYACRYVDIVLKNIHCYYNYFECKSIYYKICSRNAPEFTCVGILSLNKFIYRPIIGAAICTYEGLPFYYY